ncbi:hypothetical protein C2R22_05030 [Salinigranum rubrum]|uniref:Uncharacterized protein n=1 Tax=Salinigranum rubrum TaxID=755307 RepID=A0A2I8VGQ7_9EURY|nr:hypothetical protein [Salinigranum rubrum]AUV81101.1 hypothetical protein C2R22_05030 [Salinigranum rubrum]
MAPRRWRRGRFHRQSGRGQLYAAGDPVVGYWTTFADPVVPELVAGTGFDFVVCGVDALDLIRAVEESLAGHEAARGEQ